MNPPLCVGKFYNKFHTYIIQQNYNKINNLYKMHLNLLQNKYDYKLLFVTNDSYK